MKNKLIYTGIIASIFIVAMIVYKDSLTLPALILIVAGNIGMIKAVWMWLNTKEENKALRIMNKSNLKLNAMDDNEIQVILAQVNYINNNLSTTHPTKQVALETIENLESIIGGGGIKNQAPNQ